MQGDLQNAADPLQMLQADAEEGRNVFEEGSNFTLQALEQQAQILLCP